MLYAEFLSPPRSPSEATQGLRCQIQIRAGLPAHLVTFTAPSEIAIIDFILALFPGRGYVEMDRAAAGWRSIGLAGKASPLLTARGSQVLVDAREAWQPLIANCAVNWVMQMQHELLFFHAAAVAIGGEGVLIAGEKGAGKSTLSLALAALGHDFFGDEIASVRTGTFELTPFRRAVSVRPGPQAPQVEEKLRSKFCFTEKFPDGTVRSRASASQLFPAANARPQPLRWVFFLRGFEERPRVESFHPRSQDLRLLAPLACTFWGRSSAARMTQVAKLLSTLHCYFLYLGQPEDTAKLVERIVRSE
jgi:energy-coupling factor transporter ATP-binding protein EcfA2